MSPVQFWEAPTHTDIIEFENFLLQLKNQRFWSKTLCDFSIILIKESMQLAKQEYKLY